MVNLIFLMLHLLLLSAAYGKEFNSTPLGSKIVGGETCDYDTFNFALHLLVDGVLRCGAALLTELFAVSAGQCIVGIAKARIRMRSGLNYVVGPMTDHIGGEERLIKYAIPHPKLTDLDHGIYTHDVAVIKMMSPFTLKPQGYATTIDINDDIIDCFLDANVLGWGFTSPPNPNEENPHSTVLKRLEVEIITEFQCIEKFYVNPRPTQLCARSSTDQHHYVSKNDVGGPLVLEGELVGIASKTYLLARDVCLYTRISDVAGFISQITGIKIDSRVDRKQKGIMIDDMNFEESEYDNNSD